MSTVVLVRPGCTDFAEQNRIQGSLDLPLNKRGYSQLSKVVEALRDLPVEAVVTGPCDPCRSTAQALSEALDVTLKAKDGLRHLDQGLWQGMSVAEIKRKFPRVYKQWEDAPETVCPPEGETVSGALERIAAALKKPLRKYDSFVVVASEPLASLVSCLLRGETPDDLSGAQFGCCDDHLVEVIESRGSTKSRNGHSHELPIPVTSGQKS